MNEVWSSGEMTLTGGNWSTWRETCPNAILPNINPTGTEPGLNQHFQSKKHVNNCLHMWLTSAASLTNCAWCNASSSLCLRVAHSSCTLVRRCTTSRKRCAMTPLSKWFCASSLSPCSCSANTFSSCVVSSFSNASCFFTATSTSSTDVPISVPASATSCELLSASICLASRRKNCRSISWSKWTFLCCQAVCKFWRSSSSWLKRSCISYKTHNILTPVSHCTAQSKVNLKIQVLLDMMRCWPSSSQSFKPSLSFNIRFKYFKTMTILWNTRIHLPNNTASHPTRLTLLATLL